MIPAIKVAQYIINYGNKKNYSISNLRLLVYLTFRSFGGSSVPTITNCYWDRSDKDKEIIENIVDKLSVYSTVELMKITHKQTPWKESYKLGHNAIITKKSIQRYFTKKVY